MVNEFMDFITLRDLLDVTDGNLASHLNALEKNDLIEVQKQVVGKKPNTKYTITKTGRKAFTAHLETLAKLIQHS
jgi:DNA-binding PadR family transcriptional regulator